VGPSLESLVAAEPRFVEVSYFLGQLDVARQQLDEADAAFDRAYAWHPQWPTLTLSVANVAMTAEEFERALHMYDATLQMEPRAVDALLGRVRALTFLGKNEEAIATVDQLLAERWYLGDARYWRALNETQLERYDEAWADIELAAKLLINAEVPKLAGIISYRRHELEVSRAKFDESRSRNVHDCETGFYLGVVLAELRQWPRTAEVLLDTARCLDNAEEKTRTEIAEIAASTESAARKAKKIAKREQLIAAGRRMRAQSWFNTAVAYFNLSRRDDARSFDEKVVADEEFGERARDLLSRLK
jgi:tetratricopeptide (TPR) repeat protein